MLKRLRQQTIASRTAAALVVVLLVAQSFMQAHGVDVNAHSGEQACQVCHAGGGTTAVATTVAAHALTPAPAASEHALTGDAHLAVFCLRTPPPRAPPSAATLS